MDLWAMYLGYAVVCLSAFTFCGFVCTLTMCWALNRIFHIAPTLRAGSEMMDTMVPLMENVMRLNTYTERMRTVDTKVDETGVYV